MKNAQTESQWNDPWLKSFSDTLFFFCRQFSRLVLRQNPRRSPSWCQKGAFDLAVNSHYNKDNNTMRTGDEKKQIINRTRGVRLCVTMFSSLTLKETFGSLLGEFVFGPWNLQSKCLNPQQSPDCLSRAPKSGLNSRYKFSILSWYIYCKKTWEKSDCITSQFLFGHQSFSPSPDFRAELSLWFPHRVILKFSSFSCANDLNHTVLHLCYCELNTLAIIRSQKTS